MRKSYSFTIMMLFSLATMYMPENAYAVDPPQWEYEAALASITEGSYYLTTEVNGTKFYVTQGGSLTDDQKLAYVFPISKIDASRAESKLFDVAFKIEPGNGAHFSNTTLTDSKANLIFSEKVYRQDGGNNRGDWESQIFYLNSETGKYAIRSCNTAYAETSWLDAGRAFWTWYIEDINADHVLPTPCYSYDVAYIWTLELPSSNEQYIPLTALDGMLSNGQQSVSHAEAYDKLVDANISTKWGGWFNPSLSDEESWPQNSGNSANKMYIIVKAKEAVLPTSYFLVTGNDTESFPGRNWASWKIYGGNFNNDEAAVRNGEGWTLIDVREDEPLPQENYQTKNLNFNQADGNTTYKYFWIEITKSVDGGDIYLQMSEWGLGTAAGLNRYIKDLEKQFETECNLKKIGDFYQIGTAQDLKDFADLVNNGVASANAKLIDDIDLSEVLSEGLNWTPIGNANIMYKGHFNGGGHIIKNFISSADREHYGLFGTISFNAIIENFTINGKLVIPQNEITDIIITAGVVGLARDKGVCIRNVNSYLNFECPSESVKLGDILRLGGILGTAYIGTIDVDKCSYFGNMTVNDAFLDSNYGGIVGYIHNNISSHTKITNCLFNGSITNSYSDAECTFGGIAGYVGIRPQYTIVNNLSIGTINAMYAGMIFGCVRNQGVLFDNNYYLGDKTSGSVSGTGEVNEATQVTSEQLSSGEICYKLNGNQTNIVFYQTIGEDEFPTLDSSHKRVYYRSDIGYINTSVDINGDPPVSQYEAALAAITDGAYYIATDVKGKRFYLTQGGALTDDKDVAFVFPITKVDASGAGDKLFDVAFKIEPGNGGHFCNTTLTDNKANLLYSEEVYRQDGGNNRDDWERQIFYLNSETGKYAIRSCNTAYAESSWLDAGRAFWTWYIKDPDAVYVVPTPCYTYDVAYIWTLELPSSSEQYIPLKAVGGMLSYGQQNVNHTESYAKLVDMNVQSKWGGWFNPSLSDQESYPLNSQESANKMYIIIKAEKAVVPTSYFLVTGNDTGSNPDRNWASWKIYGGNFNSDKEAARDCEGWTLIDEREDEALPASNFGTKDLDFNKADGQTAYQYFWIEITKSVANADIYLQMSEWGLGTYGSFEQYIEEQKQKPTSTDEPVKYFYLSGAPDGFGGESQSNLFDGTSSTKWCCSFTNREKGATANGGYIIFKASRPMAPSCYSLTTANDTQVHPERNWKQWQLYGMNATDEANVIRDADGWVLLDDKSNVQIGNGMNELPAENYAPSFFTLSENNTTKYRYFKIEIDQIQSSGVMQMSEFALGDEYTMNFERIFFADANVKAICIANWDTNKDGELTIAEAAAVKDLGEVFKGNMSIKTFEELKYFTGLTAIGDETFEGCDGLTSIVIPDNITSIGDFAFYHTGLTFISIPSSVIHIGNNAFDSCHYLESIVVESGNPVYDSRNNSNALIETASNTLLEAGINTTTIPNGIVVIGDCAFDDCEKMTLIDIPNSVKIIGNHAFATLEGVITIIIPKSVTKIGDGAFYDCSNVKKVIVGSDSPLSINNECFTNQANATLYVPSGSKEVYAVANYWQGFGWIIEYPNPDVNQDGDVNVLDVVDIARFVVGKPALTFHEFLADINCDGSVNLGDAVVLINDIAGDQNFVKALVSPNISGNDILMLKDKDGNFSLCLNNERQYTAFQFDLYVPENANVSKMVLNAQRNQKHQLLYNKVEEGHYRVVALSTSNNEFKGIEGELLNMALNGVSVGEISIRNIHFFNVKGNDYLFDDINGSTTSLDNIEHSTLNIEQPIYNAAGQRLNKMQKGINIVGTKKVIVK